MVAREGKLAYYVHFEMHIRLDPPGCVAQAIFDILLIDVWVKKRRETDLEGLWRLS